MPVIAPAAVAVAASEVVKVYGSGATAVRRSGRRHRRLRPWRADRDHGLVRVGQVHPVLISTVPFAPDMTACPHPPHPYHSQQNPMIARSIDSRYR